MDETTITTEPATFRRYYLGVLLLGLVLFGIARSVATYPTETGSLLGAVTDVDNRPLADIEVVLSNGRGEPRRATTDDLGKFSFLNLDPGNYTIEAYGQGYARSRYDSVHVGKGRSTTLQMQLRFAVKVRDDGPIRPGGARPDPDYGTDRP